MRFPIKNYIIYIIFYPFTRAIMPAECYHSVTVSSYFRDFDDVLLNDRIEKVFAYRSDAILISTFQSYEYRRPTARFIALLSEKLPKISCSCPIFTRRSPPGNQRISPIINIAPAYQAVSS